MSPTVALYDCNALRVLERRAAATCAGGAFELMQRAGQAAWQYLLEHWPQAQRIVVACGPGNNGGDGYVLARLAKSAGCRVSVVIPPEGNSRTVDAARAWSEWREAPYGQDESSTLD